MKTQKRLNKLSSLMGDKVMFTDWERQFIEAVLKQKSPLSDNQVKKINNLYGIYLGADYVD